MATFSYPDRTTACSITFLINRQYGDELKSGERWVFMVPRRYKKRILNYAILKHRKDKKYIGANRSQWDPNGAYLLFKAHNRDEKKWYTWYDRFGSRKFAEHRSADDPEHETFHDCLKVMGPIQPDMVSLENHGQGDIRLAVANVHELELVFFPRISGTVSFEQIFTPGTRFINQGDGTLEYFSGGGPDHGGRYPWAVLLGAGRKRQAVLVQALVTPHRFPTSLDAGPWGHLDGRGRLHISLPPGYRLDYLELFTGDTDISNTRPDSATITERTGWARLNVWLGNVHNITGKRFYFIVDYNVPPAGIVAGVPRDAFSEIHPGDEIIVESLYDTTYLMAYRLTLTPLLRTLHKVND